MDTNVFRYVLTVAECKSISGAARKLFISQPALTKQLSKLEHELGYKLFDRNHSPVRLTPSGELFLKFISRYSELENELNEQISQLSRPEYPKLTVATTHRGGGFAGRRTAAFLSQFPQVELEYLDMSAKLCEEALERGDVELVLYTDPVISDQVEYMPLEEDPLIFVVPEDSPLLQGLDVRGNSLERLVEIPAERFADPGIKFILSTPNHSLYYAECSFFRKHRITPVNHLRVDYVDTRYSVACSGEGVVLVPVTTVVKGAPRRKALYCTVKDEPLYRYVVIGKKRGKRLSKSADAFWRFMISQRF